MRIWLDECVTKKLKKLLPDFEVFTVVEMGWSGLKNGNLPTKAVEEAFDILLTIDKNMDHQQHIQKYSIALVVLDVEKSNVKYFLDVIPEFLSHAQVYEKGKSYTVTRE